MLGAGSSILGLCGCCWLCKIPAMVFTAIFLEGCCIFNFWFSSCYWPHAHLDFILTVGAFNPSQGRPCKAKEQRGTAGG